MFLSLELILMTLQFVRKKPGWVHFSPFRFEGWVSVDCVLYLLLKTFHRPCLKSLCLPDRRAMLWQLWRHSYGVVCWSKTSWCLKLSSQARLGAGFCVYYVYYCTYWSPSSYTVSVMCISVYTLKIHTCMYNLVLFHLPEYSLGRNHNRSSFAV